MITKEQQETLADIFANSERPDKMRLWVDWTTNSVVVHYYDLDEQWLSELAPDGPPKVTGTWVSMEQALKDWPDDDD